MLKSARCRVSQLSLLAMITLCFFVGGFLGTVDSSFSLVPLRPPTNLNGWSRLELHAHEEKLSRGSMETNSTTSRIAACCGVGGLLCSFAFAIGTQNRFRRNQSSLCHSAEVIPMW